MYLWWQVWKPQHHHQAHSICVNWAYASIIWVTFDELSMLFMDLNMNPCYVTPCSPIYTYVSRHIRVCYCKLYTSTKELVLSYFIVMRCLWNDNDQSYMCTPLAWWALWLPWWPPAGCNNALMYLLIFTMNFCYWCAILIAHQIVMAKHGGSCVHFSGISTCGRTSRETVSHPQSRSTVTNSVQNIFTHLRYCDK